MKMNSEFSEFKNELIGEHGMIIYNSVIILLIIPVPSVHD